jgi:hypothetical protein
VHAQAVCRADDGGAEALVLGVQRRSEILLGGGDCGGDVAAQHVNRSSLPLMLVSVVTIVMVIVSFKPISRVAIIIISVPVSMLQMSFLPFF